MLREVGTLLLDKYRIWLLTMSVCMSIVNPRIPDIIGASISGTTRNVSEDESMTGAIVNSQRGFDAGPRSQDRVDTDPKTLSEGTAKPEVTW